MDAWITIIKTELNSVKTGLLSLFVIIGAIRIIIEGIKYKTGTDDERLDSKKKIRGNVLWFMGIPFCLWLALYLYNKATGVA